jgi:hypothetical protein
MNGETKLVMKQGALTASFVAGAVFAVQILSAYIPLPGKAIAGDQDLRIVNIMIDEAKTISEIATLLKASQAQMSQVTSAILNNQADILTKLRDLREIESRKH